MIIPNPDTLLTANYDVRMAIRGSYGSGKQVGSNHIR